MAVYGAAFAAARLYQPSFTERGLPSHGAAAPGSPIREVCPPIPAAGGSPRR
jgi:hypothetical protein